MKQVLLATIASVIAFPAWSQETANVASGEETRVGWIGSVGENCAVNPAPQVKPSKVADHGQIKLAKGDVKTNSVPACPGIMVPAIVVFYTSFQSYKGNDQFTLSVDGEKGSSERVYSIVVK